jgi:hypothetical protein
MQEERDRSRLGPKINRLRFLLNWFSQDTVCYDFCFTGFGTFRAPFLL